MENLQCVAVPVGMPKTIRSKLERAMAESERRVLLKRMHVLCSDPTYANSEFIQDLLERMQAHHDHLEALIEAYDKRQISAARALTSQSTYDLLIALPTRLIQARRERAFSLTELSRRSGVPRRTLIRYEKSHFRRAPFEVVCALARALEQWP